MKLCSICDKKIEGRWCKNCHRFVKSYELPGRIYLNQSHNVSDDAGCSYHTFPEQPTTGYEKRTDTSFGGSSGTYGSQTKKPKNTGKKVIAAVGIFYAVVIIIGIVANVSSEVTHDFVEEVQVEFPAEIVDEEDLWKEQIELNPETEELLANVKKKIEVLKQLQPAEVMEAGEFKAYYYAPEEIAGLGFSCSEFHFDRTLSQFDAWLSKNWTEEYEVEEDSSLYYNCFYEDVEYIWIYFSTFRDYYASDDFAIRVNYDTATEQLHMIGFVSTMEKDALGLCFSALKEFDPDTDLTEEQFRASVEKVLETEEYVTFYRSDVVELDCEVKDGMYSISFYPVYRE